MRRSIYSFLYLLLASFALAGQEADNAKKQAQRCADAQIAKDYATVVSFTHPAIIKMGGGKEPMRKAIESAMKEATEQGVVIEKTVIHSASEPKKVGKTLVSQVVQEVNLRLSGEKWRQESVLLGYSYDAGKNWVFADTVEMDEATFNKLFPELNGVIDLPKKKDLVIVKDK